MSTHTQHSGYSGGGLVKWIDSRLPVFTYLQKEYGEFPAPRNFNYWWNFGAILSFMLVVMIFSGIFLAMQYTPHVDMAFDSVERIMRDVNYGWLLRYIHANGGTFFFIAVYIHIFRGLYYGSYKNPRELLWIFGVVILVLMMATAFMGYVLPWGQMSFWGATVITNLFSAIPLIGDAIVTWLWGGFAVDNPTLNRFYALHYLLPFVIFAVVALHVIALHITGSNNPMGIEPKGPQDTISFHPYYTAKDSFGLALWITVFAAFVFFAPNFFGEPENYIEANPLKTPAEIVPEWYFLPYFAILRAINFDIWFIDAKLGGVIAMFGSILLLFVVPWLDRSKVRSARFRPLYKWFFWILVLDCFILGFVGGHSPDELVFEGTGGGEEGGFRFIHLGQISTFWYFFHFIVLLPVLGMFEKPRPLPTSISEPVLGGGQAAAGAASKPMEKA